MNIKADEACFWLWQNNLFGASPSRSSCALHLLAAAPNQAALLCETGSGVVRLRGDGTVLDGIPIENAQHILDGIAASALSERH